MVTGKHRRVPARKNNTLYQIHNSMARRGFASTFRRSAQHTAVNFWKTSLMIFACVTLLAANSSAISGGAVRAPRRRARRIRGVTDFLFYTSASCHASNKSTPQKTLSGISSATECFKRCSARKAKNGRCNVAEYDKMEKICIFYEECLKIEMPKRGFQLAARVDQQTGRWKTPPGHTCTADCGKCIDMNRGGMPLRRCKHMCDLAPGCDTDSMSIPNITEQAPIPENEQNGDASKPTTSAPTPISSTVGPTPAVTPLSASSDSSASLADIVLSESKLLTKTPHDSSDQDSSASSDSEHEPTPATLPHLDDSSDSLNSPSSSLISNHKDECESISKQRGYPIKRGLSVPPPQKDDGTCYEARALGLSCTWYYNWGFLPRTHGCPDGTRFSAEFVPMVWGCLTGNCTRNFPDDWRQQWEAAGVTTLMGFNEPDSPAMADLTPWQAANYWSQIDALAQSFSPRLKLVGPGMTHWRSRDGSSDWLDKFFYYLTKLHGPEMAERIDFLAQHDFTGNVQNMMHKSKALYRKYGRKIYLTEFAVRAKRSGGLRAPSNDFLRKVLPHLDKSYAIERYAWFSTLNDASVITYVGESSLINYAPGVNKWHRNAWSSRTTTGKIYAVPEKEL